MNTTYGDGLYNEAGEILGMEYQYLAMQKRLSEFFKIKDRSLNLSWRHHYEIASLKQIEEDLDGKRHYGDGLYKEASEILGIDQQQLRQFKSMSDRFELLVRANNLTWRHHYEVSSLKQIEEGPDGKLRLSECYELTWRRGI